MGKVFSCNCKHEFQDKEYGQNKRLFNHLGDSRTKYRCTVCGKEIDLESKSKK